MITQLSIYSFTLDNPSFDQVFDQEFFDCQSIWNNFQKTLFLFDLLHQGILILQVKYVVKTLLTTKFYLVSKNSVLRNNLSIFVYLAVPISNKISIFHLIDCFKLNITLDQLFQTFDQRFLIFITQFLDLFLKFRVRFNQHFFEKLSHFSPQNIHISSQNGQVIFLVKCGLQDFLDKF